MTFASAALPNNIIPFSLELANKSTPCGNNLGTTLVWLPRSGSPWADILAPSKNLLYAPLLSRNPIVLPNDIGDTFWL